MESILELQRDAVKRMLNVGDEDEWGGGGASHTFKVLVYDKFCQEVVAPLLKIGGLRHHGVTLNTTITSERSAVPGYACVYFVEPTLENIKLVSEDLEKGLYDSCHVNFASEVPRSLLEELARGALKAGAGQKVQGVFDRYVSFVSLSHSLFTLNLPSAYETLHSTSIPEQHIHQYIERIVDGLLSALITMKALPVIRCPPETMAEMVARRLEARIRELLSRGGAVASELFSGATTSRAQDTAGGTTSSRPMLCLLDRDADLVTMLNHTWTYQAMAHDVLGMKLKKITIPVSDTGDAPQKMQTYHVDEDDNFWAAHAGQPFHDVGPAVHEANEEWNKKRASMSDSGGDEMSSALKALPEMTEKKRSIDMHTNIATALLNHVKERELDKFYEIEDQLGSQTVAAAIAEVEGLLTTSQKGTLLDKSRALMVLYLTKPSIEAAKFQSLIEALQSAGADTSSFAFLKHLASMKQMMVPSLVTGSAPGGAAAGLTGAFGGLASGLAATGQGLLAAGVQNIRNITGSKKELVICNILDALMDHKATGPTENYLYLDPKAPPVGPYGEVARIKSPFRRAITFVVGGGNYAEMQAISEWAQTHGNRHVTYGSTDMVSPEQFVGELTHLGQALGGGGMNLS